MAWWSSASSSRDNWERLVAAVLKKEQIWDLCHRNSSSTIASDYSDGILSFSSNSLRPVSSFPSPQLPLTNDSVVEDRENASKTITQKLFSALLWKRKATDYKVGQDLGFIPERHEEQPPLEWSVRKTIALGVVAYLNQECTRRIIHRDVKAANILLDENFEAFVADFTLAKFMDCDDDDGVVGTPSHIAPEYLSTGKCTEKTDVFSYGVFLLELITGKQIPHHIAMAQEGVH